jgi:hypothetical protein
MLVCNDNYHFNQEECGTLEVIHERYNKPREFYCHVHGVHVGPTGYAIGTTPLCSLDQKYTTEGSWQFLCFLVKSLFEKVECPNKKKEESDHGYANRVAKRNVEIKELRIALAREHWKPLQTYADIAGIDYDKILTQIVKHNS